jgi:hypothetical protein
MDIKIYLYVDEWTTLKNNIPEHSAAQHCLNSETWLNVSPGQSNVEIVCNDAYAFELQQEATLLPTRSATKSKWP